MTEIDVKLVEIFRGRNDVIVRLVEVVVGVVLIIAAHVAGINRLGQVDLGQVFGLKFVVNHSLSIMGVYDDAMQL